MGPPGAALSRPPAGPFSSCAHASLGTAGGENGASLDLASVERLLVLEPGATLVLANISLTGARRVQQAPSLRPSRAHAFCPPAATCCQAPTPAQPFSPTANQLCCYCAGFGPIHEESQGREWANGTKTAIDPFPLYPTISSSPNSTVCLD